jgi:hypothetical protein
MTTAKSRSSNSTNAVEPSTAVSTAQLASRSTCARLSRTPASSSATRIASAILPVSTRAIPCPNLWQPAVVTLGA